MRLKDKIIKKKVTIVTKEEIEYVVESIATCAPQVM